MGATCTNTPTGVLQSSTHCGIPVWPYPRRVDSTGVLQSPQCLILAPGVDRRRPNRGSPVSVGQPGFNGAYRGCTRRPAVVPQWRANECANLGRYDWYTPVCGVPLCCIITLMHGMAYWGTPVGPVCPVFWSARRQVLSAVSGTPLLRSSFTSPEVSRNHSPWTRFPLSATWREASREREPGNVPTILRIAALPTCSSAQRATGSME